VTYGKKLFNNKVVYFLGSLSLPLYLCHSLTRRVINSAYKNIEAFNDLGVVVAIVVFFVISFAFVFVAMPLEKVLRKAINNKLEQLSIKKQ
jgi:peptidoglycan/LPS O-acetylase OafA/YrhL